MEGKFLERKKYKSNQGFNEFIVLRDFQINKNIMINGFNFEILTSDDYSANYLEENIK